MYLNKVDETENLNEKILILKQAEVFIFDKINTYNLKGCEKVLETCKRKIELLEYELRIKEPQPIKNLELGKGNNESKEPENPHPTIFTNGYAYQIFIEWHRKYKSNTENYKANYSYLIRNMIKDKLIYDVKQGAYLDFLKDYDVIIDKIKPLIECKTTSKDTIYLDTKNTINTRYNLVG